MSEHEVSRKVHQRLDEDVVRRLHVLRVRWDYKMTISDVIRRLMQERDG
jgi:hypothetical protein